MNPGEAPAAVPTTGTTAGTAIPEKPMAHNEKARALLRASSMAVARLLREHDFEKGIAESLRLVGEGAEADRSILFSASFDAAGSGTLRRQFEWDSEGTAQRRDGPEDLVIGFDMLPSPLDAVLKGEICQASVRDLDESARSLLDAGGGLSIIVLPISVDDVFWGFVRLDDRRRVRLWNDDEKTILLSYAIAIGAVMERANRENELRAAKAAAESANKAKSAFVANVSHEIRTPLNAILGFAELVMDRTADSKIREYGEGINTAGHNLLSLINDILDLSKIEANRLEIRPRPISLPGMLAEMRSVFSVKSEAQGLEYDVSISEDLPETIIADPTRMRQILFNLLGNAFKYTERGFVRLGCTARRSGENRVDIEITVADSGIGIPESQHSNVFEAFRQQEDDSTRKYGGTGLGLTITRRLANLMGGRITVRSAPGEGSVFTVHLPKVPVTEEKRLREAGPAKNLVFAPATVLLVDDIASNRAIVRGFLEKTAIRLLEAENGHEAIEIALVGKPDMIFMDMEMPVMDGRAALARLRGNPLTARIPVVALTASALAREDEDVKTLCDGYLRKPVSMSDFFAEMSRFLNSEGQKDANALRRRPGEPAPGQFAPVERFASPRSYCALFEDKWLHASELLSIDDLGGFAGDLAIEASRQDDDVAMRYAAELADACASFDLIRMESVFARFPELAGFTCRDRGGAA
jgi:signal transduction histidine kinase/ActR/RegA family two-component response regulator